MHWPSHVKAFQIQWIYRYLDPRSAPWKQVLDHWLAKPFHLGRATLLTPRTSSEASLATKLPESLHYVRQCIREFEDLGIYQDTSTTPISIQAEPLFENWRFTIPLSADNVYFWKEYLHVTRISDLYNDDGALHTTRDWERFFYTPKFMPTRHHKPKTPTDDTGLRKSANEWADDRIEDLLIIQSSIPSYVFDAIAQQTPPSPYVGMRPSPSDDDDPHSPMTTWAQVITPPSGGDSFFAEVWLDANSIPHHTGITIPWNKFNTYPASLWHAPKEPDRGDNPADALSLPPRPNTPLIARIAGTLTSSFPINAGWILPSIGTRPPQSDSLSTLLAIHNLTEHLTAKHLHEQGNVRPNNETNWPLKLSFPISLTTFLKIYRSIGTPLTDPSIEKVWRRLLGRALYSPNRDPSNPVTSCRLGCYADDSQLHLVQCPHTRKLFSRLLISARTLPNTTIPPV